MQLGFDWTSESTCSPVTSLAPSGGLATLAAAVRLELGAGAWLEHRRGWVHDAARLYDVLRGGLEWESETRWMYDREVATPRLLAPEIPDAGVVGWRLRVMASNLGARYGVEFDAWSAAFYRDGRDSVAWHRDRQHRDAHQSVVAIVSLGGVRRFSVRPFAPYRHEFEPNGLRGTMSRLVRSGDLLVMGGASQRSIEHSVPKLRSTELRDAEPRIALMFRHRLPFSAARPNESVRANAQHLEGAGCSERSCPGQQARPMNRQR